MIQYAHAPPCGNAAILLFRVPEHAERARLERTHNGSTTTVWEADGGGQTASVLDYAELINDLQAIYQLMVERSGAWSAEGAPVALTPRYAPGTLYAQPDFVGLVQRRLEPGLAGEIAAGGLHHAEDFLPVLTAYPQEDSVRLPVVTAILTDRRADVRGIGDVVADDLLNNDAWYEFTGWFDRSSVEIVVWARSHAERIAIRDAVQRVLMLNLPIFQAAGYQMMEMPVRDTQDFESYSAPVFQSIITLSAQHPTLVSAEYARIQDVALTVLSTH